MKLPGNLLAAIFLMGVQLAHAESIASNKQVRNYDWLTNGKKSGSHVLTIDLENQTRIAQFEFKDRGRGPSLLAKSHIGENERLIELIISGHSYMGAPVDENFISTCEGARWSSPLEEGSSSETDHFYLANDGTPEQTAQLARALLAAPEGSLNLLPNGRATINKLSSLDISVKPVHFSVDLYAISGAQMNPQFIWLDEHLELFGLAAGSNALVPEGLAGVAGRIKAAQEAEEARFYQQRSTPLTRKLPSIYLVSNVNVIDVDQGTVHESKTVVVKDGLIHEILGSGDVAPTDTIHVDGNDGWLMPGLWDMHTHNRLPGGLLHIAGGVTTVRDLGNNPDNYLKVSKSFDSGEVIGPRSYAAGIVEGKSPFSAPIDDLAENEADAVALVQKYAALGYPQIKIYSSTSPAWVPAVAAEAHRNNMRVSGHIPAFMNAEQAIRDGYDEIQHIYMLYLNFLASETDDTRTPLRFTLIAEKASELDMESPEFNGFLDLLKSRDITIDPTVAIVDNMLRHRSGTLSPSFAMVADHLPPAVKRGLMAGRLDINDDNAEVYAASADTLLVLVRKLHEKGIRIVAGTDSMEGFGLHRELELYQQAGIPAADVLRLATLGSAKLMGAGDTSGSLVTGKQADMVLLAENPLENISAVRTPQLVFKGDRYFEVSELYKAVGIKPFTD